MLTLWTRSAAGAASASAPCGRLVEVAPLTPLRHGDANGTSIACVSDATPSVRCGAKYLARLAMLACCDDTTSDYDEHNTDNDAASVWSRPCGASAAVPLVGARRAVPRARLLVRPGHFHHTIIQQDDPDHVWTCTSLGCALLWREHREGFRGLTRLPADGAPAVLLPLLVLGS